MRLGYLSQKRWRVVPYQFRSASLPAEPGKLLQDLQGTGADALRVEGSGTVLVVRFQGADTAEERRTDEMGRHQQRGGR